MMNIEDIKTIMKLMAEYQLTEFSVEADGSNISMRREGSVSAVVQSIPQAVAIPAPVAAPAPAPAASAAPAAAPAAPGVTVESPLVGTFYAAPSPSSKPFVKVGDRVAVGQVVCIIEAMKLMNEITATESGTIEEILVENGDLVEYGQPLFVIS